MKTLISSNHYYYQSEPFRYQNAEFIFANPELNRKDLEDATELFPGNLPLKYQKLSKSGAYPCLADKTPVKTETSTNAESFLNLDAISNTCYDFLIGENEKVTINQQELNLKQARKLVLDLLKNPPITSASLDDWLISRQRYWGTPIPIVHCPEHGPVPVETENLPVTLPSFNKVSKTEGIESPLASVSDFVNTQCPICNGPAKRETDTMDTFVDSSWYYLRYLDRDSEKVCDLSKEAVDKIMPVDVYIGGLEHATLHLFFARFIWKHIANTYGYSSKEPFKNLMMTGLVKGLTFQHPKTNEFIPNHNVTLENDTYKYKNHVLKTTFQKMSKSKHNGLNPEEVINDFGWSQIRSLLLYKHSPDNDFEWGDTNFELKGIGRWSNRVWHLITYRREARGLPSQLYDETFQFDPIKKSKNFDQKFKKLTKQVANSRKAAVKRCSKLIEHEHGEWSSYIGTLLNFTNMLFKLASQEKNREFIAHSDEFYLAIVDLVRMSTPVCPLFCAECWDGLETTLPENFSIDSNFDFKKGVMQQKWPV